MNPAVLKTGLYKRWDDPYMFSWNGTYFATVASHGGSGHSTCDSVSGFNIWSKNESETTFYIRSK